MNKLLASRGLMSVLGVAVVCAILTAGYFAVIDPPKKMRGYCATMPDAIGLYTGNHVTMRGVRIGTVTHIEPRGNAVRVDFEIDANHSLRGEASAATLSDTIVADRSLSLLDDNDADTEWDSRQCISRTLTPKSMTQTMDALGKLAAEITDGSDPAQREQLSGEIAALDTSLSGTGPEMNETILRLGRALDSPNAAIGHIGALIDSLQSLTDSVAGGWGDIKAMITRLAPGLEVIDRGIFQRTVSIIDSLRIIVPWLNEITTMFGDQILQALDATVPLARLASANVGTMKEIIEMTPPLVQAFQKVTEPQGGRPVLTYAAPRAALPPADAERVCAAINLVAPSRCATAADGLVHMSILPLVLGTAGVR
ncbi:MlaD family protein [Nocardia wallacei]|uniref:MlaD family protein n=1 Tax=Nocardia wallacei TaxID=480035 RepID=UPI002456233B|nr:MlaD family protein [Nocardia wallacei]